MRLPAAPGAWWRRRALRTRLLLCSLLPLAVAVVLGVVALTAVFTAGRLRDLDRQTTAEAATIAGLVQTDQLTSPLPLPAGSPLLAQVLGPDGKVLAASQGASRVLPLAGDPTHRASTDYTDADSPFTAVPLRIHVQPVTRHRTRLLVAVAAPMTDVRRAEQALRTVLLLVVPILIALAAGLAWLVTGAALRPVERLRQAAAALAADPQRLTNGRPGTPIETSASRLPMPPRDGADEISRLGVTFNDLLGQLQAALAQQRTFVADAAHELRSPLTSLRIQLDVSQSHPDLLTVPELASALSGEVDRLIRLTDDLLLLARLEARAPLPRSAVDLTEIAGAQGAPVLVWADADVVRRIIRNLRDNAERHASRVRLTTSTDDQGDFGVLCVDDNGPGIPPEDRERVFHRWERLDQDRSRAAGGSGLGLALVRELVIAHGGHVVVSSSPLGGARLIVRLPAAETADDRPLERSTSGRLADGPGVSSADRSHTKFRTTGSGPAP